MADFKRIDDASYQPDRTYPTVIPKRIEENIEATRERRGRAFGKAWDLEDMPRICCYRRSADASVRACIAFIIRVAPGLKELRMKTRHHPQGEGVNIGMVARPLEQGALTRPVPKNEVEIAASAETGLVNDVLTLDVERYTDPEWPTDLVVWWTLWSEEGDPASVGQTGNYPSEAARPSGLFRWHYRYLVVDYMPDPNPPFDAISRAVIYGCCPCLKVEFFDENEANSGVEESTRFGPPKQVIRFDDAAPTESEIDYWYVWPALDNEEDDNISGVDAWLYLTELGYTDLASIELREHSFTARRGSGTSFETGKPTRSQPVRDILYRPAQELYLYRAPISHIGPSTPDLTLIDTTIPGEPYNKVHNVVPWSDVRDDWYTCAMAAVVPAPNYVFENVNRERTRYHIMACVALSGVGQIQSFGEPNNPSNSDVWELAWRVRLVDPDRSSNEILGEERLHRFNPLVNPFDDSRAYEKSLDLLMSFFAGPVPEEFAGYPRRDQARQHSLAGVIPSTEWGKGQWVVFEFEITDDTAVPRLVQLQANAVAAGAGYRAVGIGAAARIHVVSFTVQYTIDNDFSQLGDS